MAAQARLEPGAGRPGSGLAAQRGELAPEVGAGVGVALPAPAGARGVAVATGSLAPERLVREVGAKPVESDARQWLRGVAEVGQRLLEQRDVGGGLLVRVARSIDRVEAVEAATDGSEALARRLGEIVERPLELRVRNRRSSRARAAKSSSGGASSRSRAQTSVSFAR